MSAKFTQLIELYVQQDANVSAAFGMALIMLLGYFAAQKAGEQFTLPIAPLYTVFCLLTFSILWMVTL
jgi:hypothetical protein